MILRAVCKALRHAGYGIAADVTRSVVDMGNLLILRAVHTNLDGYAERDGLIYHYRALGTEYFNSRIVGATHIKAEKRGYHNAALKAEQSPNAQ